MVREFSTLNPLGINVAGVVRDGWGFRAIFHVNPLGINVAGVRVALVLGVLCCTLIYPIY